MDAVAVPAVVIARVTDIMSSDWVRVSACWSRCICCCVGAVRRAVIQALVSALDGAVVVAVAPVVGAVVVGDPDDVGEVVAEVAEAGCPVGKNDAHVVKATDAWPSSAVMAFWALVTRCWA